ncbi:MAG: N-acetylmuramic acid 6-phosphate etherase, partial [Chitinophagaceae bacterium]
MGEFIKVTEQESRYHDLEKMSIAELLVAMNTEDQGVPLAVAKAIPQIEKLVAAISQKMEKGGRLFYLGAGTSGRLGVLDASEIPPTYDMPHGLIVGLMAGGEVAIRKSVEAAEDSLDAGWAELTQLKVNSNDVVVGIAA